MPTIAIMGPTGSESFLAAKHYTPSATLRCFNSVMELVSAFETNRTDLAMIPFYNTREGLIPEYFKSLLTMKNCYWVDNVVLPVHLSMGALQGAKGIDYIVGRGSVFNQCKDYIKANYPAATLVTVVDIESKLIEIAKNNLYNYGVIESEELLKHHGLALYDREVVSHNKTRFAVLAKKPAGITGFDATAVITRPLQDRVGMLVDILSEFTRRGINILDLQSENDVETQKLQIYLEIEGHHLEPSIKEALGRVSRRIIQEKNALKILGSYPRVEMRVKHIKSFGFIGTGKMSQWFADKLRSEGYSTLVTGRNSQLSPEKMIPQVDVVVICVPISVTADTIQQYGRLLKPGQALILLAGESENNLKTALKETHEDVEVMLVHNLWGPRATTMKDKNVAVVRTARSGKYCSEFEAFLYKHGAEIYKDSAQQHDLLMGVGQKLPTLISVALAATLAKHNIQGSDIHSHSTLTSIYGILAMSRIHCQNPRTYAEIMSTKGDGRKIVKTFAEQLQTIITLSEEENISELCKLMEENAAFFGSAFIQSYMHQAKAVDEILKDSGSNYFF